MTRLIKLWDEKDLILKLKNDTLVLIRNATTIPPVKKLVEANEILDLTQRIMILFPSDFPDPPIGDEGALMRLREIAFELSVLHRFELPVDHTLMFDSKVKTLLKIYRLPKERFS